MEEQDRIALWYAENVRLDIMGLVQQRIHDLYREGLRVPGGIKDDVLQKMVDDIQPDIMNYVAEVIQPYLDELGIVDIHEEG